MNNNPFEELLMDMVKEIIETSKWKLDEDEIMFIVRKHLNPFPPKPVDTFAQLIKTNF